MALSIVLTLTASGRAQDGKAFVFPADKAGKRLESLLRPGDPVAATGRKGSPLARPAPRFLEKPEAPLPALRALPPELKLREVKLKQPSDPAEPLLASFAPPPPPEPLRLPEGTLARWPSIPVDRIPPLPVLATPQRDRASLADPTMEASLARAMQAFFLPRTTAVPFAPINLPDPFELRRTIELRDPPAEDGAPLIVTFPRLPEAPKK
ncbi:MAG: hypothetical protein U0793_16615 [Gemmataceae bacterium]